MRSVGNIKVTKIFNGTLDRDKAYPNNLENNILKNDKLLNIALSESLKWGKDFLIPLDIKIMSF